MTFCYVERENIEGLEGMGAGRITHHAIFFFPNPVFPSRKNTLKSLINEKDNKCNV